MNPAQKLQLTKCLMGPPRTPRQEIARRDELAYSYRTGLWLDNYFESAYSGLTFHRGKVKQTMPKSQSRLCVVFFALLTFFSLPKNAEAQITIYSTIGPVGLATSIGFVFQYTNCAVVAVVPRA